MTKLLDMMPLKSAKKEAVLYNCLSMGHNASWPGWIAVGLCVVLVLCRIAWPDGASTLRRWIVGDGSEQVQQAFFRMEQALEEGDGLGEAWEAFCGELTDAPA